MNKIKLLYIIVIITFGSLILISCTKVEIPPISYVINPIFSTSPYPMNEDIIIDIHIGIGSENASYQSDLIYRIAVTNNVEVPFGDSDNLLILSEITDYSEGKYHWIVDEGKITYPYVDQFVIPAELFSETSGYFYIGFLEIHVYEESESIGGMMYYKYQYDFNDGLVTIAIA